MSLGSQGYLDYSTYADGTRRIVWEQVPIQNCRNPQGTGPWIAGPTRWVHGLGVGALAGSLFSGMWLTQHLKVAAGTTTLPESVPLSVDWDEVTIRLLVTGPDGALDVFVASTAPGYPIPPNSGALRCLRFTDTPSGFQLASQTILQNPFDNPACLAVSKGRRVIVGGRDAANRILWSQIPADPSDATGYQWRPVILPAGWNQGITHAVAGPNDSFLFGGYGGVSIAEWIGPDLVLRPLAMPAGFNAEHFASAYDDPSQLYAFTATQIGLSLDGGATWSVKVLPASMPMNLGNGMPPSAYLAVSPSRPGTIAYLAGGVVAYSRDSGQHWDTITLPGGPYDERMLRFDMVNPERLWLATPAGLATRLLGEGQWDTSCNRSLRNLISIGAPDAGGDAGVVGIDSRHNVEFEMRWGDLGVSPAAWSNIAFQSPFSHAMTSNHLFLGLDVAPDRPALAALWDPQQRSFGTPIQIPGADPYGFAVDAPSRVENPTYQRGGKRMWMIGNAVDRLYGLFANDDGTAPEWIDLGYSIPWRSPRVLATASYDGNVVLISRTTGMERFEVASGLVQPEAPFVALPVTGLVWREPDAAFAFDGRTIYRRALGNWAAVGTQRAAGGPLRDPVSDRLFLFDSRTAFVSENGGVDWAEAETWLPRVPGIVGLALQSEPGGATYLYASTTGWGLWRARADDGPRRDGHFGKPSREIARIVFGVTNDGNGIEILFGPHGVRHVPPRGPARELASLIGALSALGDEAGPQAGRLRREILKAIIEAADRQLERGGPENTP